MDSIVENLREIGWGEEIDKLDYFKENEFQKLPSVRQFKALTTRGSISSLIRPF